MLTENEIANLAVDLCFKIHKQYGPGLFEPVYEEIFCYEWQKNGIQLLRQHPVPLVHESIKMDVGFRADMIIDNKVIVELKINRSVSSCSLQTGSNLFETLRL